MNTLLEHGRPQVTPQPQELPFRAQSQARRTTAIFASLTSTCRCHDLDSQLYLTQLLFNLPGMRQGDLRD